MTEQMFIQEMKDLGWDDEYIQHCIVTHKGIIEAGYHDSFESYLVRLKPDKSKVTTK